MEIPRNSHFLKLVLTDYLCLADLFGLKNEIVSCEILSEHPYVTDSLRSYGIIAQIALIQLSLFGIKHKSKLLVHLTKCRIKRIVTLQCTAAGAFPTAFKGSALLSSGDYYFVFIVDYPNVNHKMIFRRSKIVLSAN